MDFWSTLLLRDSADKWPSLIDYFRHIVTAAQTWIVTECEEVDDAAKYDEGSGFPPQCVRLAYTDGTTHSFKRPSEERNAAHFDRLVDVISRLSPMIARCDEGKALVTTDVRDAWIAGLTFASVLNTAVDPEHFRRVAGGVSTRKWTHQIHEIAQPIFDGLKRSGLSDDAAARRTSARLAKDHGFEVSRDTVKRHLLPKLRNA